MSVTELPFTILSSSSKTDHADPTSRQRPIHMDILFKSAPVHLHAIAFENYYTANLTILHATSPPSSSGAASWTPVVSDLQLMADPHCEDDAQDQHELFERHFAASFKSHEVTCLRFVLLQPSPLWKEHALKGLRCFSVAPRGLKPLAAGESRVEAPVAGSPDSQLAEAFVAELLNLAQLAQQISRTFAELGPSRSRGSADRGAAQYCVGEWDDLYTLINEAKR